jgi:hypothetical protein
MALLRSLFWFALFLVSTFVFTVLFEHGFRNFGANAEKEFQTLTQLVSGPASSKKDGTLENAR